MDPCTELSDEVAVQLNTATGYTFERRITAYYKRDDLVEGKWVVIAAGDAQSIRGRDVDRTTLIVDVGYQIALPESSEDYPDPVENRPFIDAQMLIVENVKNPFRGEGSLRHESFLGFSFSNMTNTPIYRPDLLIDKQIFTAVIRLEFVGEIEAN